VQKLGTARPEVVAISFSAQLLTQELIHSIARAMCCFHAAPCFPAVSQMHELTPSMMYIAWPCKERAILQGSKEHKSGLLSRSIPKLLQCSRQLRALLLEHV
jgi:hypothetical protein